MPYVAEVQTDKTADKWYSNDFIFETWAEAIDYSQSLRMRWMSVRATRVLQTDEPVTHVMVGKRPVAIHDAKMILKSVGDGN